MSTAKEKGVGISNRSRMNNGTERRKKEDREKVKGKQYGMEDVIKRK